MKQQERDAEVMSIMKDGITRTAREISHALMERGTPQYIRHAISRCVARGDLVHLQDGRLHSYKLPTDKNNTTNPFEWRTYKSPWL